MDIEKLINQMRFYGSELGTTPLNNIIGKYMLQAATALSTLQIENQALRNAANGFKAENEQLRADLARVTAERDAAVKKYEAEKEDFLDYALSGTQNAAPFCTNRHPDCVDKRGWCVPVKCHGFSRDKEV